MTGSHSFLDIETGSHSLSGYSDWEVTSGRESINSTTAAFCVSDIYLHEYNNSYFSIPEGLIWTWRQGLTVCSLCRTYSNTLFVYEIYYIPAIMT